MQIQIDINEKGDLTVHFPSNMHRAVLVGYLQAALEAAVNPNQPAPPQEPEPDAPELAPEMTSPITSDNE